MYFDRFQLLGIQKISYTGGEALLHPQFENALELGQRRHFTQILTSNGDILFHTVPACLKRLEYLKLSFYGSKEIHDALMGAGHYGSLLGACKSLQREGISIGANYMLSKDSLEVVEDFLRDAANAKIDQVLLIRYVPLGRQQTDFKFDPGQAFSGAVGGMGLRSLAKDLDSYHRMFRNGIKIHDYSYSSFFVVLTEEDRLTLPRSDGGTFDMGGLFDAELKLPDGRETFAASALESIWETRRVSEAILPVGDDVR